MQPTDVEEGSFGITRQPTPNKQPVANKHNDANLNSLKGTGYNLTKTSIGCGMIFLPKAMHQCGLALGSMLIAFSALVTLVPQVMLSNMSTLGVTDYISLSRKCYRKSIESVIVILQLLLLFTPMIAYIKLNGLFASSFIMSLGVPSDSIFADPVLITILLSVFVIFPLCLLKNLSKLSFASVMGLICVAYLCILTILDYFYDSWVSGGFIGISSGLGSIRYFSFGLPLMSSFNTFILAYTNHPSILPLISEMRNPTHSRRSKLIFSSQGMVFLFYLLTTCFGYLHFGTACENSIAYIMLKQNSFYLLAQLLVVFVNIITFPLIHWPARLSLDWLIREVIKKAYSTDSTTSKAGSQTIIEKFEEAKQLRHVSEAVILVAISCISAILFPSILSIFDFFVPISGSFILFTIPSVCYLKCMDKGFIERKTTGKLMAYCGLATGLLHFSIGTTSAVCTYILQIK